MALTKQFVLDLWERNLRNTEELKFLWATAENAEFHQEIV